MATEDNKYGRSGGYMRENEAGKKGAARGNNKKIDRWRGGESVEEGESGRENDGQRKDKREKWPIP